MFKEETSAFNRALLEDLSSLQGRSNLHASALRLLIEEGTSGHEESVAPLLPFRFDEHQLTAMQKVLSSDLTVVTGPPGTGKSELVANLLMNLLFADKSVLLVSNTNEAVNVVHERVETLFPGALLRTGNKEARQSLRGQIDSAAKRMGRSSKPFRREELFKRWQRVRVLRSRLQTLHEMNAEFERLEQDFQRESKMLGLSDASVAEIVSASRPSDRLEALLQRWRVLDGKTAGSRLTMMDRVLAVAFPHRLRKRAAKAEAAVFAAMGAAAAGLIPERDRHLSFPGVAQAVSDFITLRRTHERLAELTRELGGYPGRLALEEQILGAQDAYRETSRALLGESYLARLSQSQHGLLRNVIHQLTERWSGQVAPPPGEVSRVLSGLPLWTSTLKSLRSTFPLYCGMFDYVVFDEASPSGSAIRRPSVVPGEACCRRGRPMQLPTLRRPRDSGMWPSQNDAGSTIWTGCTLVE